MATTKTSTKIRASDSGVEQTITRQASLEFPVHYADKISRVGIGPQVCKLELTNESIDGSGPRTSGYLVVPVTTLYQFAKHFIEQIENDNTKNNLARAISKNASDLDIKILK